MPDASRNGRNPALGSDWGGLSPHLIASFFPVELVTSSDGRSYWDRDRNGAEVRAPLTDANMEVSINWQSPFENTGPDKAFSSASALIQSGIFSQLLAELGARFDSDSIRKLSEKTRTFEDGSNFSRLNSLQTFTGMPPIRLPVTAHFKAQKDPRTEVRDPINQLIQWSLPQDLTEYGAVGETIAGRPGLYQSRSPRKIGLKYADLLLQPLVIEAIAVPVAGQRYQDGTLAIASVSMQLSSLVAFDSNDWKTLSTGGLRS